MNKDNTSQEIYDTESRLSPASSESEIKTDEGEHGNTAQESCEPETHVTVIRDGDCTYHIIGTAHVSEQSRLEVARVIESVDPDKVCIELCQERYDSFKDEDRWKKLNIFEVIKKGKFLYLLMNIAVGAFQRKMGAKLGVKPGAELIGAAEVAEKTGAEVVLIDRNLNITLKRVWANLGFFTKCHLMAAIMESLVFKDENSKDDTAREIEKLKEDANLSSMMDVFAKELPEVHLPLIDERDRFLVAKMRECGGKNVVAVVGAGHVPGMQRYYHTQIDTDAINVVPPPSMLWRLLKWLIPLVVIGGIAYGVSTQGFESLAELLNAWILPNSVFCFLFCILALGHPLTCLAGIVVSPLTSTTPFIGAGIVLGLLEAWLRKPTVEDCEDLPNLHSLKDFYKNRFTHTLIVCVLATFGSAFGAWIGLGWLYVLLGLNG